MLCTIFPLMSLFAIRPIKSYRENAISEIHANDYEKLFFIYSGFIVGRSDFSDSELKLKIFNSEKEVLEWNFCSVLENQKFLNTQLAYGIHKLSNSEIDILLIIDYCYAYIYRCNCKEKKIYYLSEYEFSNEAFYTNFSIFDNDREAFSNIYNFILSKGKINSISKATSFNQSLMPCYTYGDYYRIGFYEYIYSYDKHFFILDKTSYKNKHRSFNIITNKNNKEIELPKNKEDIYIDGFEEDAFEHWNICDYNITTKFCFTESGYKYSSENLKEFSDTPWVSDKGKTFSDEIIIESPIYPINTVLFANGFYREQRPDLYIKNNRVKEIQIIYENHEQDINHHVILEDSAYVQFIPLYYVDCNKVTIKILSIYDGDLYDDTCINYIGCARTNDGSEWIQEGR